MRNRTALLYSILAVATAIFAIPGPASAAVPGFDVQITELPGEFAAGAAASTLTVVASTDAGRRCQKVRWSMLMRVDGINLSQVKVDRVEDNGSFPLSVRADGDTARLTDVQLDPGSLCRDSTVTARYQVSFASEVTDGQVTFQAEAYDATERLLQQATATREVVNGDAASDPAPSSEPSPTPSQATGDGQESTEPPEQQAAPSGSDAPGSVAAVPRGSSTDTNLLGVGVIVGAVLIFLGVGLLLRLRLRNRRNSGPASLEPFRPAQ